MRWVIVGGIAVLAVAAYLLYPLVNVIEADDPLPGSMEQQVADSPVIEMSEPMPEAEVVAHGVLVEGAHEVQGRALLVQADGKNTLRFEDLDTVNGPDLRIYLSKDLTVDDAVDLGPIKATKGNVNYELDPTVNPEEYPYVLIWCRAFSVLFSYAELA